MVSEKRPKYQYKRILDHSFLFTTQNVAYGCTPCHLENWFFHLYVSLKSLHGRAQYPDKLKYRKKAPL